MTKKVECKLKPASHGHHDEGSPCPWCEPQDEVTRELPAYDHNAWGWVDAMLTYHGTTKSK